MAWAVNADSPIGVFDTGVGGFSVVLELRKILPCERIVYFGDSANMPYGSRSVDDILYLTRQICAYMQSRGVKAAAVACNTISTVIDRCRGEFPFPMFSIIEAGARAAVADSSPVGLIGTPVTARSQAYPRLIRRLSPGITVVSAACPHLSALIEAGKTAPEYVDGEIKSGVDDVLRQAPVKRLILACTHYPLVRGRIAQLYPNLELIDPARRQAQDIEEYLAKRGLLRVGEGSVELNTSGSPEQYRKTAQRVGIASLSAVNFVCPAHPLEKKA
ncbi:MAG: glutamate racemase [Pyramidobacter sp.]|jgi:glutamate racemase